MKEKTDVFVIGGGPAGLAAGIAARQKGFEVVVADGAKPPLDKSCGEGLLPEALHALRNLGVRLQTEEGFAFRGIRFLDDQTVAEATFHRGVGMGVKRVTLHRRLLERAEEIGVRLLWRAPVTGISQSGIAVGGMKVRAQWIVGADGTKSQVRRWTGLETRSAARYRYACRRHYNLRPWTDMTEVYWGQGMQAYVTPVGMEEVCVVLLSDEPRVGFETAWRQFPKLHAKLTGTEVFGKERGGVTATQSFKRVRKQTVVLLGDASGGVDAITGEGLRLSFQQAMALAEALATNNLAAYEAEHRRLIRRPAMMGKLLLIMGRHAGLRGRTMKMLAGKPAIFSKLLALHSEESPVGQWVATSAQLGWQLLSA